MPEGPWPQAKEPRFFIGGGGWPDVDAYEALFAGAGDVRAVGEATPGYTGYPFHTGVPGRIQRLLPDARLIYLIRDPMRRLQSHYLHQALQEREARPMGTALLDEEYLHKSRYATQIEQYLDVFPRSQLLVVDADDLRSDRRRTMSGIFDFIGVDPGWHHRIMERECHVTQDWFHESTLSRRTTQLLTAQGLIEDEELANHLCIDDECRRALEAELRPELVRLRELVPGFHCWGLLG